MDFTIRAAVKGDIPSLLELCKSVDRIICFDEIWTWMQIDPGAILVAESNIDDSAATDQSSGHSSNVSEISQSLVITEDSFKEKSAILGLTSADESSSHSSNENTNTLLATGNFSNSKLSSEDNTTDVFQKEVPIRSSEDSLKVKIKVEKRTKLTVASCCGMRLSSSQGFMGLYMVHKNYRKRGIGKTLWDRALKRLGNRNIGVRGDYNNFKNYVECYGFQHAANYTIVYYECFKKNVPQIQESLPEFSVATFFEGQLIKVRSCSEDKCAKTLLSSTGVSGGSCEIINDIDVSYNTKDISASNNDFTEFLNSVHVINSILDYDRSVHKRDRSFLVKNTLTRRSCRSTVAFTHNKQVVGYACMWPSVTRQWIISPFYADSDGIAKLLLEDLFRDFEFDEAPRGIQIRFPDKNSRCRELLQRFGFKDAGIQIFTGYTKECADLDLNKIFSFHSTVFCSE